MNHVVLKGNLTRDPESRSISVNNNSTVVVNFTLAVNRHFRRSDGKIDKETTYVDCEAWDSGAETIVKYVKKGDPLLIFGALKLDVWEVDGQKRSRLKVRVKEFELLYRKPFNRDEAESTNSNNNEEDPTTGNDGIPF